MALEVKLAMPTATETSPGTLTVSVEATLLDKETVVDTRTFSQSISATKVSERESVASKSAHDEAAKALTGQIMAWRTSVERVAEFAPMLEALKTAIEGGL